MRSLWEQFDRIIVFDTETTGIDFSKNASSSWAPWPWRPTGSWTPWTP